MTFIGLLDLTDNVHGSQVVHPPQLMTYDDNDPYLVVAADKGTAAWSDRANEIAAEYGFWLGDAFATGGSHGYHHKRLGITARGAWVCVRRHFRELGRDADQQAFTVVGVGSMDGDVFGNGLLQSNNIRLLAAFSAQHIFLDPTQTGLPLLQNESACLRLRTRRGWIMIQPLFRRAAECFPAPPKIFR